MKIDFGEPIEFEIPIADSPLQNININSLSRRAEIDVFVLKSAHDEMIEHVNVDKNIECGGILVGYPFQDSNTKEVFVVIVGIIRDLSDNRSVVHFTVTPDVISKTREALEEKYPELIAVGWYHSHPGHGVFLSGQDMTIVRGIYNEKWNLAWVIDPIREQEGIFYGADGSPLVINKSSNPLHIKDKQTWFTLDEYPQCIKDLQQGKLKTVNETIKPRFGDTPVLPKSTREEKESRTSKKNNLYVFIGLGITSVIIVFLGVLMFLYIRNPIINPTATPLVMPTVFTPVPSNTPSATPEWTSTPPPTVTVPVASPSYP